MRLKPAATVCGALLAICGLHGCGMSQPPLSDGLSLTLTDRDTQNLIPNATIIAESGEYKTWVVDQMSRGSYFGAHKPGIYTVTISQDGYKTKVLNNVVVLPDHQGVRGPILQVELEPDI